ncbi:PKD domain-containing protein [Nanoarchaeota archaeon]
MERKHIVLLACLGILMLLVAGCQGYKPPKYKSPDEGMEDEEVDIDLSELDEDEAEEFEYEDEEYAGEDEYVYEDEDVYEEDTYEEPAEEYVYEDEEEDVYVAPAATVVEDEEDAGYARAAYQPLNEEDLDDMPTVTVSEGEVVKINVKATDKDGDTLTYKFGSPLDADGEWNTRIGDAGVYYSTIVVSDGKEDVENQIRIIVEPKNNKPVLDLESFMTVAEGETITLNPRVTDADGDRMTITYTGWMTDSTKVVGYQEEGEHTVTVTVTDGISRVSQEVTVTVLDVNRPPEVEIEF